MNKLNYINDAVDFQKINRILVIKLQHLGDVLLTTPIYSVIKHHYPHIKIDVLVYKETLPVLQDNPHINQNYIIDRAWKKQGKSFQIDHEYQLIKQLTSNDYDLIVNLTDRWRGAWLTRILKPEFSVSLPYTHRRGTFWSSSFSHIYRASLINRHTVELNLDALRRLGIQPQSEQKKLTLIISKLSESKISQLIRPHQIENKKLVVIHPTSRWMFKAWNADSFAQLVEKLSPDKFCVALISGPANDEIDYVRAILKKTDRQIFNFAGQLSLNESAALIKKADCFIGLDSVAMHMAAAVNTPSVVLFGPTRDIVWHPWMAPHKILAESFTCRPCGLKGCGDGLLSECIQGIQPETVVQAIKSLID